MTKKNYNLTYKLKKRKINWFKPKQELSKEINKILTKKCWDNLDNLQKQKEI